MGRRAKLLLNIGVLHSCLTIVSCIASAQGVSGHVMSHTYCEGDGRTYILNLSVRLLFRNHSARSLVMFRHPVVGRVTVARTASELADGRIEETFSFDDFSPDTEFSNSRETYFVVLRSNETYAEVVNVPILIKRPYGDEAASLVDGQHVMVLQVVRWPFSEESGKKQLKRWAAQGRLATGLTTSSPIAFEVNSSAAMSVCASR